MLRNTRRMREPIPPPLELRLDRVQIIWMTLGGALVVGLSFALGLIAGRRAERLEQREAPSSLAALETESDKHDRLTFYRELKNQPPLPKLSPEAKAEAERRLAEAALKKRATKPVAKAKTETHKKASTDSNTQTPKPATRPAQGNVKAKLNGGPAALGQYTVQVSAFQSMDEAEAFSASLERKGYAPFITTASLPKKGTWYRVRVGAFDNELEATLAKQMLAQRDIPAWVLRSQ